MTECNKLVTTIKGGCFIVFPMTQNWDLSQTYCKEMYHNLGYMLMNVSAALSAYIHTRAFRRQRTVTGVSLCPPLCLRHSLLFTAVCVPGHLPWKVLGTLQPLPPLPGFYGSFWHSHSCPQNCVAIFPGLIVSFKSHKSLFQFMCVAVKFCYYCSYTNYRDKSPYFQFVDSCR